MTRRTSAEALAAAAADLVADGPPDVSGRLAYLLADLVAVVGGGAAALLVTGEDGSLEVLASTSHHAEQIELFQLQHRSGPCMETVRSSAEVHVDTADRVRRRWPDLGDAIAGHYESVHASPLHWRGRILGALNLLHPSPGALSADTRRTAQTFADLATLTLVRAVVDDHVDVNAAVHTALADRVVIEQAKGVLSYTLEVDTGTAYDALLEMARSAKLPLVDAAEQVLQEARRAASV